MSRRTPAAPSARDAGAASANQPRASLRREITGRAHGGFGGSSGFRRQALTIFLLALSVRVVHLASMRDSPYFSVLLGDSRGYDAWARQLASGDWLGSEVFYQAPLYPYVLGAVYALLGPDPFRARVVQAIVGACASVLLGAAAARVFSPRVGLIAGCTLALYAPAIFLDSLIQKSVLDVFFICLMLWLVGGVLASGRTDASGQALGRWLGLGASLGALALTRENALALVAVVAGWALTRDWVVARHAAAFRGPWPFARTTLATAGLLLVLGPVAVRNAAVGGELVLTTSQLGPNLYIGNHAEANGSYVALQEGRGDPAYERQDATDLAERALGRPLSAGEVSAYWRGRAIGFITAQPADWLRVMWRKVVLLASVTEMPDTEAQESHADSSATLKTLGQVGHFGVLLPLAIVGAIVTWPRRDRLWVLYALTAGYAASVLVFFVVARYRYPLVPFLILFASAGVVCLGEFWRRASTKQWALAAASAAVVVVFTRMPSLPEGTSQAISETNLGAARHADQRLDEAARHYRRAIEVQPAYAPAYNNLGVTLRALGRLDEAIDAYRQALVHRPTFLEVHYNLGTALLEQRRAAEAVDHFQKARGSMPPTAGAHNNVGVALASVGRREEAAAQFQAALALEPGSLVSLRNLIDVLAKLERPAEAVAHAERLVSMEPDRVESRLQYANLLMASGRLADAEQQYRETIRLAPGAFEAHTNLGVALAARGDRDAAVSAFARALQLAPDYAPAKQYLAVAKASPRR
ncbi:MAG: tetratricopeptide repeat protein [Acidobacteriota bacterium]